MRCDGLPWNFTCLEMKVSDLFAIHVRERKKGRDAARRRGEKERGKEGRKEGGRGGEERRKRKDKLNKCRRHVTDTSCARTSSWWLNLHYFRFSGTFPRFLAKRSPKKQQRARRACNEHKSMGFVYTKGRGGHGFPANLFKRYNIYYYSRRRGERLRGFPRKLLPRAMEAQTVPRFRARTHSISPKILRRERSRR